LRNDDYHAFRVLAAEPVRGSMPSAGLIRPLFDKRRSFKIERSINHFIPVTGAVNFCPESDDIPGGGHHQSAVNRHKIIPNDFSQLTDFTFAQITPRGQSREMHPTSFRDKQR
jgi:hypothetical protein